MKKHNIIVLAGAFLAMSCTETKENKTSKTTPNQSVETSTQTTLKPLTRFDTNVFITKYNKYMRFANNFHPDAEKVYTNYLSWADLEKGPNVDQAKSYKVGAVSEVYLSNLEEALTSEPVIEEIDELFKEVLQKAKQVVTTTEEAKLYYYAQDYKDDGLVGVPVLHKRLVNDFEAYFEVYETMNLEFVKLQKSLSLHEADKYKERGEFIKYNVLISLYKTEDILNIIGSLNGSDLAKIDREKLKQTLIEFRVVHEDLKKYEKDDVQKDKEYAKFDRGRMVASDFVFSGASIIKQCRDLEERIDKNNYDYGINHKYIPADGSPEKIQSIYYNMIEKYNRQ